MIIGFVKSHTILAAILAPVALLAVSQMVVIASEYFLRWKRFCQARDYARKQGKPLLVIGRPGSPVRVYGCGDVCIDIDRRVLIDCPSAGLVADIREIPFEDEHFGAVFCSHIIDFLPDLTDAEKAVREMKRVGDKVFLCYTLELNLVWRWFGRTTRLWISSKKGAIVIRERPW